LGSPRVIEIVERAYDVDAPEKAWLESVRQAAERSFPRLLAAQAYTYTLSPAGTFRFGEIASDPTIEAWMRSAHEAASPELIRKGYLGGAVTSPDQVMGGNEDDPGVKIYANQGLRVVGANGLDPAGSGCLLAIVSQAAGPLTRQERHALERIAAHLAAAHRLRRAVASPPAGKAPSVAIMDDADAVLSGDGSVLHAVRDARSARVREALRDAARRVDRARMREAPERSPSEDDALAFWRALVDGRWSLVERFDSDGRRLFVARRNDPASRSHKALTELERKAVALIAIGHSQKMCAYELGRSESTVSTVVRTAMNKLGLRTRSELVDLYGAIVDREASDGAGSGPSSPLPKEAIHLDGAN
jgi:DNA-binding NarL/FixJ family response regulator